MILCVTEPETKEQNGMMGRWDDIDTQRLLVQDCAS